MRPLRSSSLRRPILAIGAPLLLFGLLELGLRIAGVEAPAPGADPYVGFAGSAPLFVPDPHAAGWRITATNKLAFFNAQRFRDPKPPDAYRIFCLGGSTTAGRPYDDATSFCGWLRDFLPTADPSTSWEVVNAGGISYASYRVAALMEELLGYEPDLFIIYSAHNEFLEERTYGRVRELPGWVRRAGTLVRRTRTGAALRAVLANGAPERPAAGAALLPEEVATRLDRSVGPKDFRRERLEKERVLQHYRFNLRRMIDLARSAGARVLLVTPAANLGGCSPFKSEHSAGLGEAERTRVGELLQEAREAAAAAQWEIALLRLDQAIEIDSGYADAHYRRGRVLLELGRTVEARRALERAVEEDVCPLRALADMREAVERTAADRGVPLVDFAGLVERESPLGIPGAQFFLDHVHPTVEGHRRLALAIVEEMLRQGWASRATGWDEAEIARVSAKVLAGVDTRRHALALVTVSKVYNWAGKMEESLAIARRALDLCGDCPEAHQRTGDAYMRFGDARKAVPRYRRALELDPGALRSANNLAWILATSDDPGIRDPAEAVRLAERCAHDSGGHFEHLDTLATAYAAAGDRMRAIRTAERAVMAAPASHEGPLRKRLGEYRLSPREARP